MYANGYTRAFSCLHRILKKNPNKQAYQKKPTYGLRGKGKWWYHANAFNVI